MIRQKEEKKAELRGPFRGPASGPQNQPSIGKGANCRSKNWPRFWGQIWCCKRVFSVCMCSLKWIRGACICPASWPGVKNTIADLGVQLSKKNYCSMSAMVISTAYSAACFFAVHKEGPQPRSQKCLFLRPQKKAPCRARLPELGFCSQDSMRWAETSAAWDWRPRVAGARMVLAETLL